MKVPNAKSAVLHRNVEHRIACVALYRRLLQHANKFSFGPIEKATKNAISNETLTARNTIKWIIGREFRQFDRKPLPKIVKIRELMLFGYKAEKCLRLASSPSPDPFEVLRITKFVKSYNKPGPKPIPRIQPIDIKKIQPVQEPPPDDKPIPVVPLRKPFVSLPFFVAAPPYSFIRWSGTRQPEYLSMTIKNKLIQRMKRIDKLDDVRNLVSQGNIEDIFEANLREFAAKEGVYLEKEVGSWARDHAEVEKEIQRLITVDDNQSYKRADDLIEMVKSYRLKHEELNGLMKKKRAFERKMLNAETEDTEKSANTS